MFRGTLPGGFTFKEEAGPAGPSVCRGWICRDKVMLSVVWLLQRRAHIRMETGYADLGRPFPHSNLALAPRTTGRPSLISGLSGPLCTMDTEASSIFHTCELPVGGGGKPHFSSSPLGLFITFKESPSMPPKGLAKSRGWAP